MSSKKEQQLEFRLHVKDVVLLYIHMFNIQKSLYKIEHIFHEPESHLGFLNNNKKQLIEKEIEEIRSNLNDIQDGIKFHYDFIIAAMETSLFIKISDDLKELIKDVKADIELTGEFHQCVVVISDKILKLLKNIEDENER